MILAFARGQIFLGACACAAAGAWSCSVDATPSCLLYQATGLYCAGCGATRACHALLHGHVLAALHDNLLFVSLLPVLLALTLRIVLPAWADNRWPPLTSLHGRQLVRAGVALVCFALAFMTLRNLPGAPFDLLRPLS